MARSNTLKAQAYIQISETESVLWYEMDENGKVVWHLSEDEVKKYKLQMTARIGRTMDDYLMNHPEATLWGATN